MHSLLICPQFRRAHQPDEGKAQMCRMLLPQQLHKQSQQNNIKSEQIYYISTTEGFLTCGKRIPGVIRPIMNIFNTTGVDYFLPSNRGALDTSNNQTKFSHCPMVLCTTVKTHSSILRTKIQYAFALQKYISKTPVVIRAQSWYIGIHYMKG